MHKFLMLALLAGFAVPALPCEVTAGPGAVVRLAEGKSGGMFTVGCIFNEKWEARAYYFGEQLIYGGRVVVDDFAAVSVSRLWVFREGKRIRPVLGMGLMLKESQRCHFDGDINCNRLMPLPFGFLPTLGVKVGDVLITLGHSSNASLDFGPEKKNLGLDFLSAQVVFR